MSVVLAVLLGLVVVAAGLSLILVVGAATMRVAEGEWPDPDEVGYAFLSGIFVLFMAFVVCTVAYLVGARLLSGTRWRTG